MSGDRRQEAGGRRQKAAEVRDFCLLSSISCLPSPDIVCSVVRRRSRPDDRLGVIRPGGKSELRRAVRRVTPGRGNSKESGTENTPLTGAAGLTAGGKQARVKRCGKSAPRVWQQAWQAKPRTEQGQIGRRVRLATGDHRTARPRLPGRLLDPVSNDGARGMIVTPKRGLKSPREGGQNSAYGRLRRPFFFSPSLASLAGPRRPAPFRSRVFFAARFHSQGIGNIWQVRLRLPPEPRAPSPEPRGRDPADSRVPILLR